MWYAVWALWDEVRIESQTMLEDEIYKSCKYRIIRDTYGIESHGLEQFERTYEKTGRVSNSMWLNSVCHHLISKMATIARASPTAPGLFLNSSHKKPLRQRAWQLLVLYEIAGTNTFGLRRRR